MQKGWTGNYFEDFNLGDRHACPVPRQIRAGDTSAYIALTGDRTPHFCGSSDAVHPLVTFHSVFGQTVRQISLNARANLGYADIRWKTPARLDDTLSTELEIVGLRENSNGKTGIVWVRNRAVNQRGEEVLSFDRWVMIKKRSPEPTQWLDAPVVPSLPSSVPADALQVDESRIVSNEVSGARWRFDDYAVGERIDHFDPMAVNPSDHMAFTRLFQNSAKVHFDSHGMNGQPLVYGGVIISHAYAAAFNGLEARLGIAAINAGAHANPTYAGDTVYAWSEVLETVALNDRVGALRLRTVATKNHDPAADPIPLQVENPKKAGSTMYHPAVVLDLDYWELVAR